jgi:hypothetical protein
MWVAILLLVASWDYPPWIHYPVHGKDYSLVTLPTTWAFLFDTFQGEHYSKFLIYRIDYERLLTLDAIIVALAAGLIISFRKSN